MNIKLEAAALFFALIACAWLMLWSEESAAAHKPHAAPTAIMQSVENNVTLTDN